MRSSTVGSRPGGSSPVEFIAEIRLERDKAILAFDGANEIWIPKSQIWAREEIAGHPGNYRIVVPEWLAKDKGIV